MRLALTVVSPTARQTADVVLDADPATPMMEIAAELGSLLGLAPYEPPDAALHPSPDGSGIDFNRPPRLLPPERVTRFQLPVPPSQAERRPLPVLMAVLPLMMGVAMAFLLHQVYLLAMAGLSPVMLVGSYLTERGHSRKTGAKRLAEYQEHKARIERDAQEALEAERAERRDRFPDPATILSIASGPRRRLWERRRTDPDYLLLRVGTADLPSAVELTDPEQDEHRRQLVWLVPDAPVAISLSERAVVGVAGLGEASRAVGRCGGLSAWAAIRCPRWGRTCRRGCPASSSRVPRSRGGRRSCCPWRGRSSRRGRR